MSALSDARHLVIDAAIDYCARPATSGPATGILVALDNFEDEVRKDNEPPQAPALLAAAGAAESMARRDPNEREVVEQLTAAIEEATA